MKSDPLPIKAFSKNAGPPVDFEKLAKLPDGNGYPNSIRGEDLMRNFAWCDILPSNSTDAARIEFTEVPGQTSRHPQKQISIVGQVGSLHPFRVTLSDSDVGDKSKWDVNFGTVRGNGGVITTQTTTVTATNSHDIYAEITRDASSRAVTAATIKSAASMPSPSTETTQYVQIAQIEDGLPNQKIFETLDTAELMIVENGVFSLAPLRMVTRNTYDPPP